MSTKPTNKYSGTGIETICAYHNRILYIGQQTLDGGKHKLVIDEEKQLELM